MNAELQREYRRHRTAGHGAAHALHAARVVLRFRRLEGLGLVRVVARPDGDYDWSDAGERERYGADGAWGTVGQYTLNADAAADEDRDAGWEHADSVWGHVGYREVLSPYENAYVVDIMGGTIDALRHALRSRCPACRTPAHA